MRPLAKVLLFLLIAAQPQRAAIVGIYGAETGDPGELTGCGATCSIETTSPIRTGNYSLQMTSGSGSANILASAGGSTFTVRFFYTFDTAPAEANDIIVALQTSGSVSRCQVRMDADRGIEIFPNGGTSNSGSILSVDTQYQVEVKYIAGSGSDATCTLWINGTQDATSSTGSGTDNVQILQFAEAPEGIHHFDDVMLRNDGTLPGAGQIEAIRPDDAGDEADTDWDDTINGSGIACPTGTGTTCSANLDDDPLNDTVGTDHTTDTPPDDILLDVKTISSVGTINFFRVGARIKQGSGGGGTVHALRVLISGGSAEDSGDLSPTTSFGYATFDPPTQPSSQADLDGIQIGAHHDGAQDYDFGDIWGMVDYTPAVAGLSQAPFINFPLVF